MSMNVFVYQARLRELRLRYAAAVRRGDSYPMQRLKAFAKLSAHVDAWAAANKGGGPGRGPQDGRKLWAGKLAGR